ncbi:phage holin family protein [Helicobacter bizzozeronii]|uniref:phage holin family protein n=1 Tax=Helicobacter bizzozeronii TaxID=56877 RepID=UPI000CF0BA28|nr:phage holin family protein [Helicobacter bizzozeronii]
MISAHIEEILELLPITLIGILAGGLNYFNNPTETIKHAIVVVLTSSFLCVCSFAMLSATDLPYLAQVGLSAVVGYLGIDNALEIVKKILNLKK